MGKDSFLLVVVIIVLSMTIPMITGCVTAPTKPDKFTRFPE